MSQRPSFRSLFSAVVVGASASIITPAVAADLDYDLGIAPQPAPEAKVEFGSGWYIRGDIGATRGLDVRAGDEPYNTGAIYNPVNAITGYPAYGNASAYTQGVFQGPGNAVPGLAAAAAGQLRYDATLGVGYQFRKWFRTDFTFDILQPVKNGYSGTSEPCITGTSPIGSNPPVAENIVSASCTPLLQAQLHSYTALVNGYIDLGTWYRVTPYVGAGVGLSFGHAQASSYYSQDNQTHYNISYADALSGVSFYQNWDRSQSVQYYNLAFALMGGISIDVYDHTKLDIGYRYLHLGDVLGVNLSTQQVRAGLRYMVDN